MAALDSLTTDVSDSFDDRLTTPSTPHRSSALSNKITSVLSASYADSEIRDALRTLDENKVRNTPDIRRGIRLEIQKEVIERNGAIIKDFSQVAEVRLTGHSKCFG